ncbi:hypothetical protein WJX81_003784 [Elliptochloris bilobata]|uniref:Endonuclease/exonuclease/phosphatase domain-containing protein n=1 Tax=Elliptochloris bilobata TaxID=381761 RepID=A0AAW1SLH8_9CHLO
MGHELAQREPRRGRRLTLAALVHVPQRPPLLVYSAHLEVFCGVLARITQFADIIRDSKEHIDQGIVHQAVLGDLNTMGHGVARLSHRHCTDALRLRSLGWYEAEVWHAAVLSQMDPSYARDPPVPAVSEAPGTSGIEAQSEMLGRDAHGSHSNQRLRRWGVSEAVCRDALNPGFIDPFPMNLVTLDNPAYRLFGVSLMKGKLDWILLRRLHALATSVGNDNYSMSDHKWISASVSFK